MKDIVDLKFRLDYQRVKMTECKVLTSYSMTYLVSFYTVFRPSRKSCFCLTHFLFVFFSFIELFLLVLIGNVNDCFISYVILNTPKL